MLFVYVCQKQEKNHTHNLFSNMYRNHATRSRLEVRRSKLRGPISKKLTVACESATYRKKEKDNIEEEEENIF